MNIKTCSKCKFPKSLDEFQRDKHQGDGHRSECKECSSKAQSKYQTSEKGKQAHKRYAKSYKSKLVKARYRSSEKGKLANIPKNKRLYLF